MDVVWWMLIGAGVAVSCGLLGCYLVLRRLSLIGDAISHAVLPGIALAFLFTGERTGPPVIVGAMLLGVLTSFLTDSIHRIAKVPEDASMGVVFTSLFALGVILMSNAARNVDLDAGCVLYGALEFVGLDTVSILGFDWPRVFWNVAFILVVTLGFIALFWKELKITSFDPSLAAALGVNTILVHYLLMALVAAATVASFEAVGSILVIAMLIVPGATAHLLSDRLIGMLIWAAVVGASSAVLGVLAAVQLDVNIAGMIAVVAGAEFALAVILAPRHGLVRRWLRRVALSLRIRSEDVIAGLYRLEEAAGEGLDRERIRRRIARESSGVLGRIARGRLSRRGLIDDAPTGLTLTDAGRTRAKLLVRAHRLWESFLNRELELPADHLHDSAEMMEHYLDPLLQEEIASNIEEREKDPHGRRIP